MDDGLLIEQVSTFPQLYAKTDGRYKNNRLKENAWLTISHILEETPEDCEHRWKLLRNKYTGLKREIRNTLSGSGASHISWLYFKMMGFLDKYLQTRRSYSNIEKQTRPASSEWDSVSHIIGEHDKENEIPELDSLHDDTESQGNASFEINNLSDDVSSFEKPCCSKSVVTPKKTTPLKRPIFRKSNENDNIPRHTIPTKKGKTSEMLTEKISGCFETFNKVLEKNMTEHQPSTVSDDEHFVRSLTADMSIFSRKDKICLKKKIYHVLCDHLETSDSN